MCVSKVWYIAYNFDLRCCPKMNYINEPRRCLMFLQRQRLRLQRLISHDKICWKTFKNYHLILLIRKIFFCSITSNNCFLSLCHSLFSCSPLQVRDIALHPEMFSVQNGLLTPTLKAKRAELRNHYREQIDELYAKIKMWWRSREGDNHVEHRARTK